jgi:TatD family-associated radical SAM protein
MSDIVYEYGGGLYINLTNKCPCACSFCVRNAGDGVGESNLWIDAEPGADEVMRALEEHGMRGHPEAVFCGYGEPFCALETMLEVCRRLRADYGAAGPQVRINTNGLGDLIAGRPTAPLLRGLADIVSVSLNAPNARRYAELCSPAYGERAFDAVLNFARECARYVPHVQFSVVDVISGEEIEQCRRIAEGMGIPLRVRGFI